MVRISGGNIPEDLGFTVINDLPETITFIEDGEVVYLSSSTSTADKIGGRIAPERSTVIKRMIQCAICANAFKDLNYRPIQTTGGSHWIKSF